MDTPKATGSLSGPRRLSLSASHYRQIGISSPLATSSPMAFSASATASDRPAIRRPTVHPPQPKCSPTSATPHYHQSSRTNTMRSTDISIYTTSGEGAFDERHAQLLHYIQMQRELIEQATAAIAYCRKKYSFSGTLQELSAQRLLLVSQERLVLLNRQMDQLKDQRLVSNFNLQLDDIPESVDFDEYEQESVANSVRGTLYIDKIVLNLNPSFSMKKIDKESSYAFVVLCRYANIIYATQVANVLDVGELRNNKVKFKELIVFEDLPSEVCVLIEVFAMKVGKRWDHKWQVVWDFAARALRSLKRTFGSDSTQTDANNNNGGPATGSASSMFPQNPSSFGSEFHRCGYLHITRDSLGQANKEKFYLSDAVYPLEGTLEMFTRFAALNSSVQPPRPDSEDADLRFVAIRN